MLRLDFHMAALGAGRARTGRGRRSRFGRLLSFQWNRYDFCISARGHRPREERRSGVVIQRPVLSDISHSLQEVGNALMILRDCECPRAMVDLVSDGSPVRLYIEYGKDVSMASAADESPDNSPQAPAPEAEDIFLRTASNVRAPHHFGHVGRTRLMIRDSEAAVVRATIPVSHSGRAPPADLPVLMPLISRRERRDSSLNFN
ncbi:hypothetical protein EVAR_23809_1 [Eumeta japonica]|uniref:Uncharacterized protein n=1 Tax=Eumeta variegata TaxID=151549 RepID=A0A4C1VK27_EUMVA|nr:hypothetical protein EVAR_23809_1 [Eumeta japonica]